MASFPDPVYGEGSVVYPDGSRFRFMVEELELSGDFGTMNRVNIKGRVQSGPVAVRTVAVSGGGGIGGGRKVAEYRDECAGSGYQDPAALFENRVGELASASSMHLDLLDAARVEELKRLAIIRSLPEVDNWEDEATISFSKIFKGRDKRYTYVALKADGLWYLTGRTTGGLTYGQLVDFILRDVNCTVEIYEVSAWRLVTNS